MFTYLRRQSALFSLVLMSVLFCNPLAFAHDKTLEQSMNSVNTEIEQLMNNQATATGNEKDVIQLQIFQANVELRQLIQEAFGRETFNKAFLLTEVNKQSTYNNASIEFIDEKLKVLNAKYEETVDPQAQLTMLASIQEIQAYLIISYKAKWEDFQWFEQLGRPVGQSVEAFKVKVQNRLMMMSATIDYLNVKNQLLLKQIASTPEPEKAKLKAIQSLMAKRLVLASDGLTGFVVLGDELSIPTSEYKTQLFDITGSVTKDLLNKDVMMSLMNGWSEEAIDWLSNNAAQHIFKLIVFVLILVITGMIARFGRKMVRKAVSNKNLKFSILMQDFFVALSSKAVWVIGFLIALSQLGINLTPVLAGFGVAGVVIGFALQDTLSNFASGMMLLIYRPFDVGDFVNAGGVDGKVNHMSLVSTTIRTFDNQTLIVPNKTIWGNVIKNVTHERTRRVDMIFSIGYGDDILKAEKVLNDIVLAHAKVLKDPEPTIKLHTLNSSSIDFVVRPWVSTDDYWDVYWDITREVKLRFDRENISIPFPQQDVHLYTHTAVAVENK